MSRRQPGRLRLEALESRCLPSTVTNLTDHNPGSLRDAIATTPAGGTVDFQDGLSGTITLTTANLTIAKDLTINGPGPAAITIDGQSTIQGFHIATGVTAMLSGLTIANCRASIIGGGIWNEGTLTLSNSTLSGNASTEDGAGIFNSGTLALSNSTLSGNKAIFDPGDGGGGIENHGVMTITNTTLSGNQANTGAGINNAGMLTISNSTISSNKSFGDDGGGIANGGVLTISKSIISGNSAAESGGGILSRAGALTINTCVLSANANLGISFGGALAVTGGSVSILNSTITGNNSTGGFGVLYIESPMALIANCIISGNFAKEGGTLVCGGNMTINKCTISGNGVDPVALEPDSAGAIQNGATMSLSDSTISGNSGWVGGIRNVGSLQVTNCTIANNTGFAPFPTGGGIANLAVGGNANLTLVSSTVADNFVTNSNNTATQLYAGQLYEGIATVQLRNTIVTGGGRRPNFFAGPGGNFVSQGHNLTSDDGAGFLTGPGDLINLDPQLGPLQNNGGSTQTLAPLPGSPVVDAGDNTDAPDWDQRGPGFPRIVAGSIDIGALEVQPGPATSFQISAPTEVPSGMPFDVTITALDAYGHTAIGYQGTVAFGSTDTDPGIVLPADYPFAPDDNGVHTFVSGCTLITPGNQMLTASDTADSTITGMATIVVDAGPAPPPGGEAGKPSISGAGIPGSPISSSSSVDASVFAFLRFSDLSATDKHPERLASKWSAIS
ncbi:MAG TPA: right-handed parallel beta-helix repeat-containing protein [Gemmataceae bacterium]|nr:right-handed parallel beta-helix repeat-containing protein [Gemmataceae bacterium]